jgi:signal transduction histidine kinase
MSAAAINMRQVVIKRRANQLQTLTDAITAGGATGADPGDATGTPKANPHAQLRDGAEFIALEVADTGVGLTREQFGRLFQAFAQADATTQREHGGTGLGLALCRRFCLMMGGDIEVQSKAGSGSTFTVMLPVAGPATEAAQDAAGDQVDDAEPISFHTRMFEIPVGGKPLP